MSFALLERTAEQSHVVDAQTYARIGASVRKEVGGWMGGFLNRFFIIALLYTTITIMKTQEFTFAKFKSNVVNRYFSGTNFTQVGSHWQIP